MIGTSGGWFAAVDLRKGEGLDFAVFYSFSIFFYHHVFPEELFQTVMLDGEKFYRFIL